MSSDSPHDSPVLLGVEQLDRVDAFLRGRRVALLANGAATDRKLVSTIDIINERYDLRLLFGPEHGIRGEAQAGETVGSGRDPITGVPTRSLYGDCREPTPEDLSVVDVFVVDLPDVGSRYYTYLSTLSYVLKACASADVPVVVLDRPNPLGGDVVEGPILRSEYRSFVGLHEVPVRHGLTVGEFAHFICDAADYGVDTQVVPATGWRRSMRFADLRYPWVPPSPNLPTPTSALVYTGMCLFEGTNLSEGRGTTLPFEMIGAPWFRPQDTISELARIAPSATRGAILRPCRFAPTFSKHAGALCEGVQVHVVDEREIRPYRLAVALLDTVRRIHPEFAFRPPGDDGRFFIDLLAGDGSLRDRGFDLDAYLGRCDEESARFRRIRQPALLYDRPAGE